MGNNYTFDCDCGRALPVTQAMAGTDIVCKNCQQTVRVPPLGKLRRLAGQDAYITNAAEKINAEHAAGRFPAGTDCLKCKGSGQVIVEISLVCSRSSLKKQQRSRFFEFMLLGVSVLLYILHRVTDRSEDRPAEQIGHDREAKSSFFLCRACLPNLQKLPSPRETRLLLTTIPLYAQLFQEFPKAEIFVLTASDVSSHREPAGNS